MKLLFVCTGNAGRSQMAEAMFRDVMGGAAEVFSAGAEPWDDLHPMARKLMAEKGLDLAGHHPKHVRAFVDGDIDVVVTIGDRAEAESPDLRTGTRRIHWAIDDPADADGTPDSETVFRATCQRIEDGLPGLKSLAASLPPRRDSSWAPAISTVVFRPHRFEPLTHIPLLVDAGFRHIELCCYMGVADFAWDSPRAVAELKKVAGDYGVTVGSIHPPDRGNLTSPDRTEREGQVDVLRRFIDLAIELSAGSLSIHVGFGLPDGQARAAAAARQNETLDYLETVVAPSPVILCVETLSGRAADMSNDEVIGIALGRSAAAFGVVLDTGHPHIGGDLPGLAAKAARRLQNLHLHDNDGRSAQHHIPGAGTTDWESFMGELADCGYEGPLMLEAEARGPGDLPTKLARCRESVEKLRSHHL